MTPSRSSPLPRFSGSGVFDRWAPRLIPLLVGLVPLLFVLDLRDTFDLPKVTFVYITVIALAGLWAWTALERGEIVYRPTALDRPLLVFLAVAGVATYYSLEPRLSFWGAYRIYVFGWLPMTAFAGLYWLSAQVTDTDSDSRKIVPGTIFVKNIWRAALVTGAVVGLYALLQFSGLELFDRMPGARGGRPWSSLGNPLYMGSVCMMAFALGLAERRGIWHLPLLLVTTGLVLSLSRSAWVGAAAALLVMAMQEKKRLRSWIKGIVILVVLAGILCWIFPLVRERAAVLFSRRESSNAARLLGWKGAYAIWKDYPWLGSGPDTFFLAFRPHRSAAYLRAAGGGVTQADAHNDLLQIASTTGAFGLAAFLWALAAASAAIYRHARAASKDDSNRWRAGLGTALAALFIQDQFNFSSVAAAAWAAVFLGALAGAQKDPRRIPLPTWIPRNALRPALIGILPFGLWSIGRPLLADFHYQEGLSWAAGGRLEESVRSFREAIRLHGRIEDYHTAYANRCRDLGRFDESWAVAERLAREHPRNPDVWNNRGVVAMWMTQLAGVNRMQEAQDSFRRAVELDPVFVDGWANLAKWEHLAGHRDEENVLWSKVLEMDPSHEMARQVLHR